MPKICYAAVVINSLTLADCRKLDIVVNKFCRFVRWKIAQFRNLSTVQVRSELGLSPIRTVFSTADAKLFFDILHNNIDSDFLLGKIAFRVPSRRTRHTDLFVEDGQSMNPLLRGAYLWNRFELDILKCRRAEIKAAVQH